MVSIRTQVYLTDRQRAELEELRRRERKTLAALIREAVDAYLQSAAHDGDRPTPG